MGTSLISSKTITPEQVLETHPKEIIIPDVKPNNLYETTLAVTNKTLRKRKIKILPPKKDFFSIEVPEIESIAPGLALEAKIRFKTPPYISQNSTEEFHDTLIIVSDGLTLNVNMTAFQPGGFLIFDPSLDFGFINPDERAKKTFEIENRGFVEAKLEIVCANENTVKVTPSSLAIPAKSREKVTIELHSAPIGPFLVRLPIETAAQCASKVLEIKAQIVSYSQFLVNNLGNEAGLLDFGRTLIGEKLKKKLTVVNNAPEKARFKVTVIKGMLSGIVETGQF